MSHIARRIPRPPGIRRGVPALAVALLTAAAGGVLVAPAAAAGARLAPSRPVVVLLQDHVARSWPNARARAIDHVEARRPLTGARTVLPVLGYAIRRSWLRVRLPGRPNGHTGWIPAHHTRRTSTEWQITLRLSTRWVTVYRDGRVKRRFRAVVGTPSTPTPQGRFFIEEALTVASGHAGGPFALATSARSNVYQEFAGGPGQIGMHGTNGLSGALGSASSHGCIRLSTGAITWMARRIGGGVPLTIKR
jgi:lipoprotein-anchoring transpeptidase ErfK/SrfK